MGFIAPSIWDDDEFSALDDVTQLIWFFLLTSQHSIGLPGLLKLGVNSVAEQAHKDLSATRRALDRLVGLRWVYVDLRRNLIRVPKAPKYNPPMNPNHVRGWYRKWAVIKDCPMKTDHVPSLGEVVGRIAKNSTRKDGSSWVSAWNETFGATGVSLGANGTTVNGATKQFSLFSAMPTSPAADVDPLSGDVGDELTTNDENQLDKGFAKETRSEILDLGSEIQDLGSRAKPSPKPLAPVISLSEAKATERAKRLWALQERLRASCASSPPQRPKEATSASLERVEACLADFAVTDDEVAMVLERYAEHSVEWFDGVSNWKPSNFERTLNIVRSEKRKKRRDDGYYRPDGTERYSNRRCD